MEYLINFSINFSKEELATLTKIMADELDKHFGMWYFMIDDIPVITSEMRKQWEYMALLEQISNKVATPIGLSTRSNLPDLDN